MNPLKRVIDAIVDQWLWLRNKKPRLTIMDGRQYWRLHNSMLHREDGPAHIIGDERYWYYRNRLHRVDGPAIESYGYKEWLRFNKRHRIDGPAVEYNTYRAFYIDGQRLSEEEFNQRVQSYLEVITNPNDENKE